MVGNASVSPSVVISDDLIRGVTDAIGLYQGTAADWQLSRSASNTALIDAVVHGTLLDSTLLNNLSCGAAGPGCVAGLQLDGEDATTAYQRCHDDYTRLFSPSFFNTTNPDPSYWYVNAAVASPGAPNAVCQ